MNNHAMSGDAGKTAMKNVGALQATGFDEQQSRVLVDTTIDLIGANINPIIQRLDEKIAAMNKMMALHAKTTDKKIEAANKMMALHAKTANEKIEAMNKMMALHAKTADEKIAATNKMMALHAKTANEKIEAANKMMALHVKTTDEKIGATNQLLQTMAGKIDWVQKALITSTLALAAIFLSVATLLVSFD